MKKVIRIAITGAAGQIGYSLIFRLASGETFGKDYKVQLNLLELPPVLKAAEGIAMEVEDCAFESLAGINCYSDPRQAFDGANWVLMVGAQPRGPGMERSDLIRVNGPIFVEQGKALNKAARDVRVVVVGNPCNTNCLIALHNASEIPSQNFSAMTALDENRAKAILAQKAGVSVEDINHMIIWGNHSNTMYPDFENAYIGKTPLTNTITDEDWLQKDFIKKVQQRGAEIISVRGKSSAASAGSACIDHIKRLNTPGTIFSCGILSDGNSYDVPKGVVFSFPIKTKANGAYEIEQGVKLSNFAKEKIKASTQELLQEREFIKNLLS
jgi:malate dehydrogenase